MRHQCSNCFSEFSDEAPSSSPTARVFCVFCGKQLLAAPAASESALPFDADYAREETFALGVISGASAGFPDTLRQFRAHGAPRRSDSLSPVHTDPEEPPPALAAAPWRLSKFWTSLAVGFGVGACAALFFGDRDAPRAPVVAARPAAALPVAAPPVLSGCVASPTPVASAEPLSKPKPLVTPRLEKRFWLERARDAQHNYRLTDAEHFYRRALAQSPRDSEVLSGLGEIALLRGQREAAEARFHEALDASSDYVPARVALADLQWQAGRTEAARSQYRELVEQYADDLVPPYVNERLEGDACAPQCRDTAHP